MIWKLAGQDVVDMADHPVPPPHLPRQPGHQLHGWESPLMIFCLLIKKVYFPHRMQSDCTAISLQTTIGWSDRWQTGWIWIIFNNPWFLLFLRNQNWWCDAIRLALLTRGVKMCIHVMALTWWNYDLSFLQLWQTDRSHAIEAQPGKFLLFGFATVSISWQEIKKGFFQLCWRFWLQVIGVDMRRQILTTNVWVEQVIKTYHQDFHQRRNEKIREG